MNTHSRSGGISSATSIAVIVIVIIIAAAGWSAYAAFPITKTVTQAGAQGTTQTVTQTVGSGSVQTVTTTVSGGSQATVNGTLLAPTTSSTPFTIAGFTAASNLADWYVVQQSGLAKQYIPGATFDSVPNGDQIPSALLGGQIQMAFGDADQYVPVEVTSGQVKLVANLEDNPLTWEVLVASNSSYTTIQSLHGATFAVPSVGTIPAYILEYALGKQLGWQLNTDYKLGSFGASSGQFAAVESGAAAAVPQSITVAYSFQASGKFRSVFNFTVAYPSPVLVASSSFIQQHPDTVRAAVEAFLQAGALWNSNSSMDISLLESQYHLTPSGAQFALQYTTYSTDGYISLSATQSSVSLLYYTKVITQNVSASTIVAPGFVPITY